MSVTVLEAGPLVLLQDRGRPGYAHLGVPRAGALDPAAAALANRLVGNAEEEAVLEVIGGLTLRASAATWLSVTGPFCAVAVDGRAVAHGQAVRVPAGGVAAIGAPRAGLRVWVALAGGLDVAPVLGSRSTDTLAWVGPPRVVAGLRLPLGERRGAPAALDVPAARRPSGQVRVLPGPQSDWFDGGLTRTRWTVQASSNRVGLRLDGPPIARRPGELASEGTVTGAVQVPPDGRPVVLLADHGPTGGYPVIGVVHPDDLVELAQLRPGDPVSFAPAPAPGVPPGVSPGVSPEAARG
jgi:biotin-dependent carboxylase-like uncharacterized protein